MDTLPTENLRYYSPDMAVDICDQVAKNQVGLKRLCEMNPHWPSRDVILQWRNRDPVFGAAYMRAKQMQIEGLMDECLDIADDTSGDIKIKFDSNGDAIEVQNAEFVNRSRLRIDTRKWLAGKLEPKVYGEKTQTDTTVTVKHEEAIKELA